MKTFNTLIRSKLDYKSNVHKSAKSYLLDKVSPKHNSGLRLALGATCSSPTSSILCKSSESPLFIRRKKLNISDAAKLASTPDNVAF